LLFLCLSLAARAESGVYTGLAGGGTAISVVPTPSLRGALLLESVYGITDTINWEGPLLLELGGGEANAKDLPN
jgi:hypothetical protein